MRTISTSGWEAPPTVIQRKPLAGDVVAQFEAERVAVKDQCEVGVMDLDEATGKAEVHARNAREPASGALLQSCSPCPPGQAST